MLTIALLTLMLQHPILPVKAGYVTYFHGFTNVKMDDFITPNKQFKTFGHTRIEAMLNPGSYLRVAENSMFVLESAAFHRIAVRLVDGSIAIEAVGINRNNAITVLSENLELRIVKPGLYRFSVGSANVLDGKLEVPALNTVVEKQSKLTWIGSNWTKVPIQKFESHPLERWSRYRSSVINPVRAVVLRRY